MGIGDNLLASGMARGAAMRSKRIAFGDGQRIKWDSNSEIIFRGNPNVATPGSEGADDLEWIDFYKGHRGYNTMSRDHSKWVWNYNFKAKPGEVFFSEGEFALAQSLGDGFVVIEPNVPYFKSVATNKQWAIERYQQVATSLVLAGVPVAQLNYPEVKHRLDHVALLPTQDFRQALAVLSKAALYIGPEGGLHHGAAAVGTPAVVIFGGFVPPAVTGYDSHVNLTGSDEACGSIYPCLHCKRAMDNISEHIVFHEAYGILSQTATSRTLAHG
jgi:ADP-heptose:LPS heptosyltransferase